MSSKAHKRHTAEFRDLDYVEQARSINAQLSIIGKAIRHHIRNAESFGKSRDVTQSKCEVQVERLLERIEEMRR
jgi:hypothetical protein